MKIALTGGSGFIGGYLAKELAGRGHSIRAAVRPRSDRSVIEGVGAELLIGDMADEKFLESLVDDVECIVHNAYDWDALRNSPEANWMVNLGPSLQLLELARRNGSLQYIYMSSVAVYGPVIEGRPLDEDHPAWPDSLYGSTKAMVEDACLAYYHQYHLNTSSWRPALVFGTPLTPSRQPIWAGIAREVAGGGRFDSDAGGSITSVEDVADAVGKAVGNPAVAGHIYNLVDCYLYDQQVAEIAKELSGSSAEIVNRAGGAPPRYQVISERARALGVPLNHGIEGVRRYISRVLGKPLP